MTPRCCKWKDRKSKYGKSYWTEENPKRKAKMEVSVCGEHLFNAEDETHHKMGVKDGGTDDLDNLIHLHKICHHHIHSGKRTLRCRRLEPDDAKSVKSGS